MNTLERAAHAKELLENAVFKETYNEIRNELVTALESVAFDDIEKQHELVLSLQLHKRQITVLERWVGDGTMARKRLDEDSWRDKMLAKIKRA